MRIYTERYEKGYWTAFCTVWKRKEEYLGTRKDTEISYKMPSKKIIKHKKRRIKKRSR